MAAPKKQQTWAGRHYEVGERKLPSVTTILQIVGKPALINWAANVEREMVMEAAANLYEDVAGTPKMSRLGWLTSLQQRLGTEKANKKLLERAGDIGSQVHALIEWTMRTKLLQKVGPSPAITDQAQWAFQAWEHWRDSIDLRPIAIEQTVWSEEHGYAGTMDLLAELNGDVTATDYLSGEHVTHSFRETLAVIDWKSGKRIYQESFLQNAAYRHAIREMGHGDPKVGLIVRLPKVATDPTFDVMWCPDETESFDNFLHAKRLWEWAQKHDKWLQKKEAETEAALA